jgi:hypothetical protein
MSIDKELLKITQKLDAAAWPFYNEGADLFIQNGVKTPDSIYKYLSDISSDVEDLVKTVTSSAGNKSRIKERLAFFKKHVHAIGNDILTLKAAVDKKLKDAVDAVIVAESAINKISSSIK